MIDFCLIIWRFKSELVNAEVINFMQEKNVVVYAIFIDCLVSRRKRLHYDLAKLPVYLYCISVELKLVSI